MKVQSMSLCVPGKCINNCAYCVSQMHDSPYKNRIGESLREYPVGYLDPEWPRAIRDYHKRLEFGRDNGTNSIVLTGTCEPMQHRNFLSMFAYLNDQLGSPFKMIDIQTTGVFLDEAGLDFLQDKVGVTTIALSMADVFDHENNFNLQGVPPKLRFDMVDLCRRIRDRGLTLRICLNLTDVYTDVTSDGLLGAAEDLGGEQLVLRQMFAEKGGTTEKDLWIKEHALPDNNIVLVPSGPPRPLDPNRQPEPPYKLREGLTMSSLHHYIEYQGKPLDILPYGATRYSVHGMSTVLDNDCMAQGNGDKQTLRYLVLREDCRLYTRWDDPASLLF